MVYTRIEKRAVHHKAFIVRQACEQYFTSSQFFAQALRHVMTRPHATQGLLGK
jgi:hypothetical protein